MDELSDDDYEDYVVDLLSPNALEWTSVPVFMILLVVGLVGNFLVVFVVLRNVQMRSATNIFLVNLALSDFLVLLFCLPVSLLWDITKTWWFGTLICKSVVFMQNLSVTVSVLTLVCISVERWYAICNPLAFKITLRWTLSLLLTVWTTGIVLSAPEALTLTTRPFNNWDRENFTTQWLTTCVDTWGPEVNKFYRFAQTILLFVLPLVIISIFYGNIVKVLWAKSETGGKSSVAMQQSMVRQDHTRRKAAKMLIAVVVLFVVCYFPVHTYNILRELNWVPEFDDAYQIAAVKLSIRFLTYFNSCINPIIYNFMSEKFQREFRRACCCQSENQNCESYTQSVAFRSRAVSLNPPPSTAKTTTASRTPKLTLELPSATELTPLCYEVATSASATHVTSADRRRSQSPQRTISIDLNTVSSKDTTNSRPTADDANNLTVV